MSRLGRFSVAALLIGVLCFASRGPAGATTHDSAIRGPFKNVREVTRKCLECHKTAAKDLMLTSHWRWSVKQNVPGRGMIEYGKRNAINNFAISLRPNWPRCTACHPGYGWQDDSFDFNEQSNVDCLICHDLTGTYSKDPAGAGLPAGVASGDGSPAIDLVEIAKKAGRPTRRNCGVCHFYSDGGDNVKHGDLDSSLVEPNRNQDVHMGVDELDFPCQYCHKTASHSIKGNSMTASPGGGNRIDCIDCHGVTPHTSDRINAHVSVVACQSCHIPAIATTLPTEVEWDWSTAGAEREAEVDKFGLPLYDKQKGDLKWKKTRWPDYAWFDGTARVYMAGDPVTPGQVVKLNEPVGGITDPKAKVYPFKIHEGRQIYDTKHNYLIIPKLAGEGGYWETFDWAKAATAGMAAVNLAYSGEHGFIQTQMYLRVNHMVVPAKRALKCANCHQKGGRIDWEGLGYDPAGLPYPKGRSSTPGSAAAAEGTPAAAPAAPQK